MDPIRHGTATGRKTVVVSISKRLKLRVHRNHQRQHMSTEGRPLSPHLGIYRWPISMTLSILHRMTGLGLSAGLLVFVLWLQATAFDQAMHAGMREFFASWFGQFLLLAWSFAFFYHLANGIRHLIWDTGHMFEKHQANASAWFVLGSAVVLTAGYWLLLKG